MTLWFVLALMCLLAVAFIAGPLLLSQARNAVLIAAASVLIVALAVALYAYQGNPEVPSGRGGEEQDIEALATALQARVEQRADDTNSWIQLGKVRLSMQDYDAAIAAFERAVALEKSQNAETLVSLAEALLGRDRAGVTGRAAELLESALALDPNYPQALFYGGLGAANRGNTALAAERWDRLAGLNPPAEVQNILQQKIAEWRGVEKTANVVVTAHVDLSEQAAASLFNDTTVFVIARDPRQPAPPVAVVRRQLSELPLTVELGDQNSMLPARVLSGFDEIELIARVSLSGQPAPQSGDWYGTALVRPAESASVSLIIDSRVE